jgi:hypothetical protein
MRGPKDRPPRRSDASAPHAPNDSGVSIGAGARRLRWAVALIWHLLGRDGSGGLLPLECCSPLRQARVKKSAAGIQIPYRSQARPKRPACVCGDGRTPERRNPARERDFGKRLKGFEPSTFCMASRRSSQLSYSRRSVNLALSLAFPRRSLKWSQSARSPEKRSPANSCLNEPVSARRRSRKDSGRTARVSAAQISGEFCTGLKIGALKPFLVPVSTDSDNPKGRKLAEADRRSSA